MTKQTNEPKKTIGWPVLGALRQSLTDHGYTVEYTYQQSAGYLDMHHLRVVHPNGDELEVKAHTVEDLLARYLTAHVGEDQSSISETATAE